VEEQFILKNEHDVISISPLVERKKGEEKQKGRTVSIGLNAGSLAINIQGETFTREK
jgi:hypothetical protein